MGWAQNEEDDPYYDCPYGSQPELDIDTKANKVVCSLPGTVNFELGGYESEYNYKSHYYISFGDDSDVSTVSYIKTQNDDETIYEDFPYAIDYTNEEIKNIGGKITHEYVTSYCDLGSEGAWEINILVIGCDPQYTQKTSTTLKLQKAGIVEYDHLNICDYNVEFNNKSNGFISLTCHEVELYKWDFGDGTELKQLDRKIDTYKPSRTIQHEYQCPGEYNVTLYGYAQVEGSGKNIDGSSCGSNSLTKPITILPIPQLIKKSDIKVCKGTKIDKVILENLDVCQYDWYNSTSGKCEKKDVCGILG
ncbi:MAG: PKD domain-containing protein, partial [Paludibacteraceae bacterium]|nr:PKD domain-containing protein [Paludibacteraceae bacterium]